MERRATQRGGGGRESGTGHAGAKERVEAPPRTARVKRLCAGVGVMGGTVPWRLRSRAGGTRRVVAAAALFAGCDVLIVRHHRRWAWGSREGKEEEEEEGEVVEVEAEAEREAAAAGRLGGAARGPEALES